MRSPDFKSSALATRPRCLRLITRNFSRQTRLLFVVTRTIELFFWGLYCHYQHLIFFLLCGMELSKKEVFHSSDFRAWCYWVECKNFKTTRFIYLTSACQFDFQARICTYWKSHLSPLRINFVSIFSSRSGDLPQAHAQRRSHDARRTRKTVLSHVSRNNPHPTIFFPFQTGDRVRKINIP